MSEAAINQLILDRDEDKTEPRRELAAEEINSFIREPGAAKAVFRMCLGMALRGELFGPANPRSAATGGCRVQRVAIRVSRRKGRRARARIVRAGRARGVRYTCRPAAAGELSFRVSAPGKRPLRSHVGNRLDLGFIAPKGTTPPAGDQTFFFSDGRKRVSFAGTWKSAYGTITFAQEGAAVRGTSDYKAGRFTGSVDGRVLRGRWSQAPDYKAPRNAGDFTFTMNASGDAFSGTWRYGSGGDLFKDWGGVRG